MLNTSYTHYKVCFMMLETQTKHLFNTNILEVGLNYSLQNNKKKNHHKC